MDKESIYNRFTKLKSFVDKASKKWVIDDKNIKSPDGSVVLDGNHQQAIDKLKCSINDVVVVYGFGSGKTIEAVLEKYKKVVVISIETIPEVIKTAVESNSELFGNPRFFITSGNTDEIKIQIDAYLSLFGNRMAWGELKEIELTGYSEPLFPLGEFKSYMRKSVMPILVNRNTLIVSSEKISDNYIKSAPRIARAQSVRVLKDRFKGIPAIVVASGPSLNDNIEDIKAAQEKSVIIAADSALSILKANDITPDYVTSVDFQKPNLIKFRSVLSEKEVNRKLSLISVPDVYHVIPYLFENYYYIPKKSLFYAMDKSALPMDLPMNAVSHLSLSIALLLGADPIIMAGYDWSYPGGADHAAGAEMENITNYSDITVESNLGDKVMTDPNLLSGLKVTETIVAQAKNRRFINVSLGGAKIAGAEVMSMNEAAEKFCKNHVEKSSSETKTGQSDYKKRYDELLLIVKRVIKQFEYFIKQSEKALKLNKISMKNVKNIQAIKPKIDESNKINNKITDDPVFDNVLSQYYFKEFYQFFRKEFDIEGQSVKERIERSNEYFNLIKSYSARLLPEMRKLKRALEYYENLPKINKKSLKDMIEIMYEYGDIYGAKAILDRLIENDSENAELYYLRAKICSLNQFMHTQAMTDYEKAKELGMSGEKFYDEYKQESYKIAALYHLADMAMKRGNRKEAKRVLQMADDCDPDSGAKRLIEAIEREEANMKLLKKQNELAEHLKQDEQYILDKVKIEKLIKEGKTEEAIDPLKELVEKYPELSSNLFLLGSIYLDKKQFDVAEIWLKKAWEVAPFDSMIAVALGKLYLQTDDYASADRFFRVALNNKPDLYELYEILGDIAYESENYSEAIGLYNKFLKASGNLEAAKKIANCYKAMNNLEAYELLIRKIDEAIKKRETGVIDV